MTTRVTGRVELGVPDERAQDASVDLDDLLLTWARRWADDKSDAPAVHRVEVVRG